MRKARLKKGYTGKWFHLYDISEKTKLWRVNRSMIDRTAVPFPVFFFSDIVFFNSISLIWAFFMSYMFLLFEYVELNYNKYIKVLVY